MKLDEDIKKIIDMLNFSNGKYDIKDIFRDVVLLEGHFINSGLVGVQKSADEFDKIMLKYNLQEQAQIWHIIFELTELYKRQYEAVDILGEIFNKIQVYNKRTGQFFTPTHISTAIAQITRLNEKEIEEQGYISLHEPTCGAGGMILACARELQDKNYNPSRRLLVVAWDIDILCTFMTFVQLSLYDIPAAVTNGDTLALKENFVLYTPQYYVFNKLLQEGKLDTEFCHYCNNEIQGEVITSKINSKFKVCTECYSTEKRLVLLKELMKSK